MHSRLLTTLALAVASAILPQPPANTPLNTCGDDFPRIVIGCWQLLERNSDEAAAVETLKAYATAGFHAFDTADIYGRSESVLGALKKSFRRAEEFISIHTKYVTRSSELSEARRINTQSQKALSMTPDLVAFHWWDYSDPSFVAAARHLVTLQSEYKLGHVAACNFDVAHLKAMVDGGLPIVSNQVQYSLLDRRPENGMLQYAKEHGIRLATFGVVAGGWLSDTWLGKPAPGPAAITTVSMRMYKVREASTLPRPSMPPSTPFRPSRFSCTRADSTRGLAATATGSSFRSSSPRCVPSPVSATWQRQEILTTRLQCGTAFASLPL